MKNEEKYICGNCGTTVTEEDNECPNCKYIFDGIEDNTIIQNETTVDTPINPPKKSKNSVIFLFIFFSLITVCVGYFTYSLSLQDSNSNNEEIIDVTKQNNSKEKENNNNIDDNKDKENNVIEKEEPKKEITLDVTAEENLIKLIDTYTSILGKYFPTENMNSLPNGDKLEFLYNNINENWKGFTEQQLKDTAAKYFNSNFTFTNQDISCEHMTLFKYDSNTGSYEWVGKAHDGDTQKAFTSHSYLVNYTYDDATKLYAAKVKILYTYCIDACGIHYLYSSQDLNSIVYTVPEDKYDTFKIDDAYDEISDNLQTYTYYFTKANDNYILEKVEKD